MVNSLLKNALQDYFTKLSVEGMNLSIAETAKDLVFTSVAVIERETRIRDYLIQMIKRDDALTQHVFLTSFLTAVIVQNVPWSSQRTNEMAILGAFLHDIGMQEIPPEILEKDLGSLTKEELVIYQSHTSLGADIIRQNHLPEPVAQIVLQHHELINGFGYPYKLSGLKIYPMAKLISLANTFAEFIIEKDMPLIVALKSFAAERGMIEQHDPDALRSLIRGFIKGKQP